MVQVDISQGPCLILESYSKLMMIIIMMMKICMESKIPGLAQVKQEFINGVHTPYSNMKILYKVLCSVPKMNQQW